MKTPQADTEALIRRFAKQQRQRFDGWSFIAETFPKRKPKDENDRLFVIKEMTHASIKRLVVYHVLRELAQECKRDGLDLESEIGPDIWKVA